MHGQDRSVRAQGVRADGTTLVGTTNRADLRRAALTDSQISGFQKKKKKRSERRSRAGERIAAYEVPYCPSFFLYFVSSGGGS